MFDKHTIRLFRPGVLLWLFLGAAAVLLPVFTLMTMESIDRQKEISLRLMEEKGAALIRSFEAGTRTGMIEIQWGHQRLQRLITETAQQPDIEYIFVADVSGDIIVHDHDRAAGGKLLAGLDLDAVARDERFHHRITTSEGGRIFQVYKRFAPAGHPQMPMMRGMPHGHNMGPRWLTEDMKPDGGLRPGDFIIFVGLKMDSFEAARSADIRQTIIMALVMLLIGIAGIMILFLAQAYRSARFSLSKVRAFSEQLMEQAPIGLIALDPEMKIMAFNHSAKQLLRQLHPLPGRSAEAFVPPELLTLIDDLDEDRHLIEKEIECGATGDRKPLPLQVTAASLYGDSQLFLGYILLFKDLSEIRALHEEITRNQRLATVGRLAAGVAHEIRNPLSSLKGFATYFKERYPDKAEAQNISDIMIQEVDRLNRVVGQLLDFSKPVQLTPQPFGVNGFLEDSLRRVSQMAASHQITVELDPLPEDRMVTFDGDKINQVLLNLYLNAIDAMDAGGTLHVSLSMNAGDHFLIRVSDNGRGIDNADLSHIFDPYFTTKSAGTGLGLAIVHNIVEAHGGDIKVESTPGIGTTVTVGLPAGQEGLS